MKQGFSELLNYLLLIDSKTVLHKDGSLSRHFSYKAPDIDSMSEDDIDFLSSTWQQAFSFLGDGWMLETNIISQAQKNINNHQYKEKVAREINKERCESSQIVDTKYILSISFKQNIEAQNRLSKIALDNYTSDFSKFFNDKTEEFISFLARSLLSINALEDTDLVSFLNTCITGSNNKLQKPFQGAFLDNYLAYDFTTGFEPKINNKNILTISIDDIPAASYPAILENLSYLSINYRFSSRFIPLGKDAAQNYLKKHTKNWSSKAIGIFGIIRESMGLSVQLNEDAQNTADNLRDLQCENESGNLTFGFYSSVLILQGEDLIKLKNISQEIINHIQQLNFKARIETVNACAAYLGSLPGHGEYNLRKMLIDSKFASHVLPISSVYSGEPDYLLQTVTKGSRPFYLSLHVGDVGHTAILGPTGTGKSTLLANLIAAHRKYDDSRIIVLDKDYSNKKIIKALDGNYFDLMQKDFQLSPLAQINPGNDYQISLATEWLRICCESKGVIVDADRQKILFEAVTRLATEPQEYKNLEHLSLQDQELRIAIDTLNQGIFKYLLNGTENNLNNLDILGFELGNFLDDNQKNIALPVITAIFNQLDLLFREKKRTLLVLEEAWCYLKHPLFQEKLVDWFKTLRKFNVAVIIASQDVSDIATSKAASTIQSACLTRIFLPNSKAQEKLLSEHYQSFGLTTEEIAVIKNAQPKRDYYYQSPNGSRLFNLELGDVAKEYTCG